MEEELGKLQQQLAEAEQNTVLAATYGKQLLEENHQLKTKAEALEQEKHCLSLKLEASVLMEQSLLAEIEQLREQQSCELKAMVAQAAQSHNQELEKSTKKILDLESIIGSQQMEIAQSHEKVELLETQLREARERLDSFNNLDQSVDDSTSLLQSQVTALIQEKQDLEMLTTSLKVKLSTDKYRLEQAEKKVMDLETAQEENECLMTSYYNALEKNKEEMMELKMEIESLKLAETDPARKGNSLFAEVEDQRQAMERQLLNYKTNYNIIKKQYDLKTQQTAKLKLQVASLLSLSNNQASWQYTRHIEESLASARAQLEDFAKRCKELEEAQEASEAAAWQESADEISGDELDHKASELFKKLYSDSQKKISELNKLLHEAQFNKVVLSDRILQLQRKLRQVEAARDASNGEVIRLRVKLDDLTTKKCGEAVTETTKEVKQVVEKIPGFDKQPSTATTSDITVSEKAVLLKKVMGPTTTIQEDENHNISESNVKASSEEATQEENEENLLPANPERRKLKKTVQLTEVVTVHDSNGQVEEKEIKHEDGGGKVARKRVLKKMECPVIKVSSSNAKQEECKTQ